MLYLSELLTTILMETAGQEQKCCPCREGLSFLMVWGLYCRNPQRFSWEGCETTLEWSKTLIFTARQRSLLQSAVLAMIDSVWPTLRPTVWPSVCHTLVHAKTTPATIMRSSWQDSPMTLVSWRLTSARNSKGNIGIEGAEWERGSKNVAKTGNF